jgi:hypothetical protein
MTTISQVRLLHYNGEDIGRGFNSDTGLAVGVALDFDSPSIVQSQESSSSCEIVTSHEELMDSLHLSAQAEGHYLFASASVKTDFSKTTKYNTVSTFVVARTLINNNVISRGHNFRITPTAKALLDSHQDASFHTAFGDSFVRGLVTGGEFYAVMRITSVETSRQESLAVSLKATIDTPTAGGSFSGDLKTAQDETNGRTEFSVVFYQAGGAGQAEIGTTLNVDEIKQRLHDFPTAVLNHPFNYLTEVATYDTVPIPVPTKEQTDAFLLALSDAEQQKLRFIETHNDIEFAIDHPDYFDDLIPLAELQSAKEAYLQGINAVIAHEIKLANGQIDPPQLFDPSKATPPITLPTIRLHKKIIGKTFKDWFIIKDDPSVSAENKRLITLISNEAIPLVNDFNSIRDPAGDPKKTLVLQAEALAGVVNEFDSIQIDSGVGLTTTAHLSSMLPSTIRELDLHNNKLIDLNGLESFSKLVNISLDNNDINDVSPIRGCVKLVSLGLSNNKVSELSPLNSLLNLERLDLSFNVIKDLSPLANLTKLTNLILGRTPSNQNSNPIEIATGLGGLVGISNPFLLADKLSVRIGILKEGPDAQFTGIATRIGHSNHFTVHLTRGLEVRDDEWRFNGIEKVEDIGRGGFDYFVHTVFTDINLIKSKFPDIPGLQVLAISAKSDNTRPLISLLRPEDRARAFVDPVLDGIGLLNLNTFDAKVLS